MKPSELREVALNLTQNSRDAFEAISQIAWWVHNYVSYDEELGNVTMSSSWVFEHRRGGCDEFVNLFLALARAAGIPARYVLGIAESERGWNFHAWAEAYAGQWIPVDVTWMQIGWLDATHLGMAKLLDASQGKPTLQYLATQQAEVEVQIGVEVKVLRRSSKQLLEVEVRAYPEVVGFERYVTIGVQLKELPACVGVKLEVKSRLSKDKPVLELPQNSKLLYGCTNQHTFAYFLAKTEKLEPWYVYEEVVDVHIPLVGSIVPKLRVDGSLSMSGKVELWLERDVVTLGELVCPIIQSEFPYRIHSQLPILNDCVLATQTGKYAVVVVNQAGNTSQKWLEVKELGELKFLLKKLTVPEVVKCGKEFVASLKLEVFEPRNLRVGCEEGVMCIP